MIEILLSLLVLISFVFISGNISSVLIFQSNSKYLDIYEQGFFGIIFLVFLSFVFHIFFPLNIIVNAIIFIFIIFIFIPKNKDNFNLIKNLDLKIISVSLLVVFLMTLKYKPNEDYGYYHLPYIINLTSEKIIFGLANLQPQFAWNSSWLNFSSLFNLPFIELKGTQLSNSVLYFFTIAFFLSRLHHSKSKNSFSYLFLLLLTTYVIIKFSRITEHGFDFPANIFLLLAFYYFLKIFEEDKKFLIKKNFLLILFFSLFSILTKLSTFASPILVLFSFIYLIKKKN